MTNDKIKTLLFDLGGVIMDIDKNRCVAAFNELGLRNANDYFGEYSQKGPFMLLEKGEISPEQFHHIIKNDLPEEVGDIDIDAAFNRFLIGIPTHRLRALERLGEQFEVALLSNTNPIMWHTKIREEFEKDGKNVDHYFPAGIVTSFEARALKPEPGIFRFAEKKLGLDPDTTCFFDDSQLNVEAARQAGFKAVHVAPGQEFMDIITSLDL